MPFLLNKEKFDALCKLREWKHPISDLARATGYTRSYVHKVINGDETLTEKFMLKYILISGVNPLRHAEWASLFFIILNPEDHDVKTLNYEKLKGHVPYNFNSDTYHLRKDDDPDLEEMLPPWEVREPA